MSNLKIAPTTTTSISWRDEILYSYGVESEGFERLKEAIKIAKMANSPSVSTANEAKEESDTRTKSAASGM